MQLSPVSNSKRYIVLDALRGFAVLGICLANYPEFSLYTFLNSDVTEAMPMAGVDHWWRYFMYIFIDGKFYTLFSLLFGIGFSIIISNAVKNGGSGLKVFYRRMVILLLIGFLHLMFIWSGDILMLYALMGMLLPLFRNVSNRGLLVTSGIFLLLPILVDSVATICGVYLSAPIVDAQWHYCGLYGITEENFAYWLRDAESYDKVFEFLIQGAIVRAQEFVDGNRYFKVFGLFLIGFYIGRNRLYADLHKYEAQMKKVLKYGLSFGLPISLIYAWSGMNGHPFGTASHTVLYTFSVYPMGIAYLAGFCLLFIKTEHLFLWKALAAPGRMALTNYISQSVAGMFIFYGIGLGLGAYFGLFQTELIALCVYVSQVVISSLWLRTFRFGPLEWIWRMLTYGRWMSLLK